MVPCTTAELGGVELEVVGFALRQDFTTGVFLESLHSGYRRQIATIHHPSFSPNPPFHPSEDFLIFTCLFPFPPLFNDCTSRFSALME